MAAVIFTITKKIAYSPNAYLQVKGLKIFQNLRIVKFDRVVGPTTGVIPPGVSSVSIVTAAAEFDQIASAVEAMPIGGSVNVTIYYTASETPPGNLVSSIVVDGPILDTPGSAPASV